MALERIVAIEDALSLDDSGTKTINITVAEPISMLEFWFGATNGATNNQANYLHNLVSKIELIDGSEIVSSLNMVQWQYLNFLEMGRLPLMNLTEWANDGNREIAYMNFGLHRLDKERVFRPGRFTNPQIRLTWDIASIRACGADAYVTGSLDVTILAHIVPDAGGGGGFLTAREIDHYTSVASGVPKTELPVDHPMRFLMIRSLESGMDFRENVSHAKLRINLDQLVLFDLDTFRIQELNRDWFGPHMIGTKLDRAHGDTVVIHTNELDGLMLMSDEATVVPYTGWGWSSNFGLNVMDVTTGAAYGSDTEIRCTEWGYTPHNCIAWPFGDPKNPSSWYQPGINDKVELLLTQADAGADVRVFVQQLYQ